MRQSTINNHPLATNDYTGPFEQQTRCAKHQPVCNECDKPAEILWKDNLDQSDTWFYQQCIKCDSHLCHDCYDVIDDEAVCICCLSLLP